MGEMAELERDREEERRLDHIFGSCDGPGICPMCDFESLNRLQVTCGKHILVIQVLHLIKGDNFAISNFLSKLGPRCPQTFAYILRKEKYSLKQLREDIQQFDNVEVRFAEYTGRTVLLNLGGLPIGSIPDPLSSIFSIEDRPPGKELW